MQFHHVGFPTTQQHEGETYLEGGKMFITDAAANPHGIEWLRYEAGSPMPEVLKTTAHVAYVVEDLDEALVGKTMLLEPFTPMEGVRVAFILDDGAPVEYMQMGA